MLFWKFSDHRTFFLNEYWIFVPTMVVVDYLIIRKIVSRKKEIEELEKLREEVERYRRQEKIRRIVYLASSLSILSYISICRGGTDFIDVDYIDCGIEESLRYLDNDRLRKIIHDLYKHKRKGKLIYITATALCHIANQYGQNFLALPFAVGNFGLTNVYQTLRKMAVTLLLGGIGPLYIAGGIPALIGAFLLATLGLKLAFTNPDRILTSPVYEMGSVNNLKSRIPDISDVISVNCRNKITMSNPVQKKGECWLPDQALFNSGCKLRPTDIPNAINHASHDLKYNEVVNMKDVTGLDRVDFSDVLDLGKVKSPISKPIGKTVNFLEKFGDPDNICEADTWDIDQPTNIEERYLRIRTRN